MADTLAAELAKTQVKDDYVVTFEGMGLKLDDAQAADQIVQAIELCPNMQILCLAGNTLGVEASQAIASALQSRSTLKFALWKDLFTGRLRTEIPPSLRALSSSMIIAGTQLIELDLSDNAFGPDGAEAIKALLTSPVAYTIQTLKFQNNGLGGGGVIIADCIKANHAKAIKEGKSLDLRTFIAGRNRLENPGAKALAEAFSLIGTLEQIEVIQNGIQYEGIAAIADCIKHSPNLRILNLNDNIMTPKGAIAVAKALPHAKKLEVLNIGDCLVKSVGALAVAENINGLSCLKEIILSFNEIKSDGGAAVAKAASSLASVKSLNLDGNHFGDEGKKEIETSLGDRLNILTGLNEDEGIPSDNEEEEKEEDEEEKKDSPEKAAAPSPFVFGSTTATPTLVGGDDQNRAFGQGLSSGGFSFSSISAGTNVFANKGAAPAVFKGSGSALFSPPSTNDNPEQEVDVHFEPLVQLEEVVSKTGEENEEQLYKHRAKVFRFDKDANAWKERGVGDLRILKDKLTGKARLIMRRDLILKLCCNHNITKQMEMKPNAGSDKSLVWFTHADFSEDEAKPEQLAVRFKTAEICTDFLNIFNETKDGISESSSTPIKQKEETKTQEETPKKTETITFANLAQQSPKPEFLSKPSYGSPQNTSGYRDEYEPDVYFEPLVHLKEVGVDTGEEGEEELFAHRCKLYRFNKETSEWKERGLGDIKITFNKNRGKGRVLMRREQILKICCNHYITADMELKPHQGNDKFLVWHTYADFADEEPKFEQLAARFKTAELAAQFKDAFEDCQARMGDVDDGDDGDDGDDTNTEEATEAISKLSTDPKSGADAMASFLAKQKDKWTCGTCYLANECAATCCIACQTPNPAAPKVEAKVEPKVDSNKAGNTGFTFGAAPTASFGAKPTAPLFGTGAAFNFGVSAPKSTGFDFGTKSPATTTFGTTPVSTFGGFTFGGAAPTPAPATPPKTEAPKPFSGFSFGSTPLKTNGTPTPTTVSIDYSEFIDSPSIATLELIEDGGKVFEALGSTDPAKVARFIGKLSRVTSNNTENNAQEIVDAMLKNTFAKHKESTSQLPNELLVAMGLIKSEDKNFKPDLDLGNMLRLLKHAVSQPYFPKTSAKIVATFINRETPVLSNHVGDCSDLLAACKI